MYHILIMDKGHGRFWQDGGFSKDRKITTWHFSDLYMKTEWKVQQAGF